MAKFYALLGVVALIVAACSGSTGTSGASQTGAALATSAAPAAKTVYKVSTAEDANRYMMYYGLLNGKVSSTTVDLQFEFLPFAGAAAAFQSRQYPIVEANWLNVAQAYAGGLKTKMLSAGIVNKGATIIAVPKNSTITDLSQLKGKKLGIIALGTIYGLEGRYVLQKKYNLNSNPTGGDIQWQEIAAGDALLGLLRTGGIDAALITQIQSYTVQTAPNAVDYKVLENVTQSFDKLINADATQNSTLVTYLGPDSVAAKDVKEIQRMLADNYKYFTDHKTEIAEAVAKDKNVDVNYLKWTIGLLDFPTGPIQAAQKAQIVGGWQAAVDIKLIQAAPPYDEVVHQ